MYFLRNFWKNSKYSFDRKILRTVFSFTKRSFKKKSNRENGVNIRERKVQR